MEATLTLSPQGSRFTYINSDGSYTIEIVVSAISTYEKKSDKSILIDLSGKNLTLNFNDTEARNVVLLLIDVQFP
jgi:hypothetical protein